MVLIDIPMPKSCWDCPCLSDEGDCQCLGEMVKFEVTGRLPNCPIIKEVPKEESKDGSIHL